MKPRLKTAMAAAEMLYSAAQECRAAGPQRGSAPPRLLSLPPGERLLCICHPCFPAESPEGQGRNLAFPSGT